jgi:signal transduction histidine kinase
MNANLMSRVRGPAVLAVDNDPGNLVALSAVLESLDCRVVSARSGAEAVELTRNEDFAAILMDVRMPGLDGYAAGSFIRQNPRSAATPILFITGHDDIDVVHLTKLYGNTGQVDALQKPFEPEVLRSKVTWWLDLFRNKRQVKELEQAMDSVQAQAQSKDELLAIVAHDLRAPLAAMKLSTAVLRRQASDATDGPDLLASICRHLDLAERNMARMSALTDELLDNLRIENGQWQLNVAPHAFENIVGEAIELLRPLAEQKSIVLAASSQSEKCTVECDRDRMLQVLSNVLGNAVKFTPAAGSVQVEMTSSDNALMVCIRDTGPGIAPDHISHVFEKYWQGGQKTTQKGVGLGLAIAKEIVLAHHGNLWVESQLGEGSRFYFSLPRA